MNPAETLKAAAAKLRNPYLCNVPNNLLAKVAAWLENEADRYNAEMVRDRPECPNCDSGMGCHHDEADFHDGSDNRAGCEKPFGGPEDLGSARSASARACSPPRSTCSPATGA
jgi:hypothetical protein